MVLHGAGFWVRFLVVMKGSCKAGWQDMLHDQSHTAEHGFVTQFRQLWFVSKLHIHFQLHPKGHALLQSSFLYMTFRDFKRLQLNPAFTNNELFPTARSYTPANIPQLQFPSLVGLTLKTMYLSWQTVPKLFSFHVFEYLRNKTNWNNNQAKIKPQHMKEYH